MAAILCQHSLVCGAFLAVCQLAKIRQQDSIDGDGVPEVVLSGEESANRQRVLRENDRVDRGEGRMAERAQQLDTVEVVHADCPIKAASDEETHRVADKDGRDLAVMVVKLLKDEPLGGC